MDILLRNGYVMDSANSFEGIRDILIRDGVIAAVGHDIPAPEGARAIDCNGKTVIPGIWEMPLPRAESLPWHVCQILCLP